VRRFVPRPFRRRLRSPSVFMASAVFLAGLTGLVTTRLVAAAEAGAARYGDPVPVLIARRDLVVGTELDDSTTELRRLPAGAVPPRALHERADGRVLRQPVADGQSIVQRELAGPGTSPLAAAVPPGTMVFAVPKGPASLQLRRGDRVDLLGAGGDAGSGSMAPVAHDAVVLAIGSDSFSVAVGRADVTAVAAAISAGEVIPALRANGAES